jgi:hypothetical protein
MTAYWVEEVTHPFGNDEAKHNRDAKGDVPGTFNNNHSQTDCHSHGSAQVARCANQGILCNTGPLRW